MKKVSIILAHFKTWKWTAASVFRFKKFGLPVDYEIIVCDNSPGHPSIKAISETEIGEGVKIVQGNPDFPSHGQAYQKCYESATGDWIFTAESDSLPTRIGWFDEYVKAAADYDYIGPEMPMGGGTYLHPAGALTHRGVIEAAESWQKDHKDWLFLPGAGAKLKLADKAYHIVAHQDLIDSLPMVDADTRKEIELWRNVGVWQEMRCFDEDTFDNYMLRTGIQNWEPVDGKLSYQKIGFEPGQWLSYFAQSHGFKCLKAPTYIHWMTGHENKQAEYSTVFGAFMHVWGGTVCKVSSNDMARDVVQKKKSYEERFFFDIPEKTRKQIEKFENE